MKDKEIIKALECCNRPANQTSCDDCPYQFIDEKCSSKLINDALDLINRQKAEIESLSIALEVTRDNLGDTREELNKAEMEIERLKSMNQSKLDMIHDLRTELETAKSEAIKEFAERLKKVFEKPFNCNSKYVVSVINAIVKEMVGEQ